MFVNNSFVVSHNSKSFNVSIFYGQNKSVYNENLKNFKRDFLGASKKDGFKMYSEDFINRLFEKIDLRKFKFKNEYIKSFEFNLNDFSNLENNGGKI